jgi:hypothetical protein
MTITPGKLRGLTQPTIILRMDAAVEEAPGESHADVVFQDGVFVFAQYVGNGRLLLTPVAPGMWGPHVVMASALNGTSSIVDTATLADALHRSTKDKQ